MKLIRCLFLAAGLAALALLSAGPSKAQPPAPTEHYADITDAGKTYLTGLKGNFVCYMKARPKGVTTEVFTYHVSKDAKGNVEGGNFPQGNTIYKVTHVGTGASVWIAPAEVQDANCNAVEDGTWSITNSNTADPIDSAKGTINPAFANPLHPEFGNYTVTEYELQIFEMWGMPYIPPAICGGGDADLADLRRALQGTHRAAP